MSFRKTSVSLLIFVLGILISPIIASAITINSFPLKPVNVSFTSYENNTLKGKVWKKEGDISVGTSLFLALFDVNNAIISKKEITIDKIGNSYWEKPFELNLFEKPLDGYYKLQARILNDSNDTVAFGQNGKRFKKKESEKTLSKVSDLKISADQHQVTGSLNFENNQEDGKFFVEVNLQKDDKNQSSIGKFLSNPVIIKKGETVNIPFSFEAPNDPQLYTAEAYVIHNESPVTGELTQNFLVAGDFGEFYKVEILPKKYIKKGETIILDLKGAATVTETDLLSAEVNLTDKNGFSSQKFINVEPGKNVNEFIGKEEFFATKDINQLFASIILWKDNNELAKTETSTEFFKKIKDVKLVSKIKNINTGGKLSGKDRSKIALILVLITLAIIIFVRGLARSNKGKGFFVFFGLILISGTCFAGYPTGTLYPTSEMAYNSDAGSGEFNTIGLWGYLSSIQGGLLPLSSGIINYEITLTKGSDIFVGQGSFTNENSFEYKIELPLNAASFPAGIPTDGQYTVEIILSSNSITSRLNDLGLIDINGGEVSANPNITINLLNDDGSPLKIIIDSTAPSPSFVFKDGIKRIQEGEFTNTTFSITPICGDNGSGCYTSYAETPIRGNFCNTAIDDRDFCNDKHEFKICDKTGNCSTESADIDFFDPVKPSTNGGQFATRPEIDAENEATFAALPGANFLLDGTIDSQSTSNNVIVDDSVCEHNNEFYLNGSICEEKVVECALSSTVRGVAVQGGICTPRCPLTFTYDSGTGYCEPECYFDKFPYCFDLVIE